MQSEIFRSYIGKDCDWNVGALFAHDRYLIELKKMSEKLGISFPIKYSFGSIPCKFQGGRTAPRGADIDGVKDILKKYTDAQICCRYTFSNFLLTEDDLKDELSNELLSLLNETCGNGVIVSSDLLAEHIRNNYTNLQLISSQVKPSVEIGLGYDTLDYYEKLFKLYDIVVVNPVKAYDLKFLTSIKEEDRGKVEFIVNHRCRRECPMAKCHYESQILLEQATCSNDAKAIELYETKLKAIMQWCAEQREKDVINNSIIDTKHIETLISMGFKHFKIEGRDNSGVTFMRDIGHWIYNPDGPYLSMVQSLMGGMAI